MYTCIYISIYAYIYLPKTKDIYIYIDHGDASLARLTNVPGERRACLKKEQKLVGKSERQLTTRRAFDPQPKEKSRNRGFTAIPVEKFATSEKPVKTSKPGRAWLGFRPVSTGVASFDRDLLIGVI